MSERVTTGQGIRYGNPDNEVLTRRREQLNKPGQHLWVIVSAWAVADPRSDEILLDGETLVMLQGPGCFKCEQPFSNRLARRPCRGGMELQ